MKPFLMIVLLSMGPSLAAPAAEPKMTPPSPLLFSEHGHDRVAIMEPSGTIAWEYPLPHPQDVWMLPNKHVIATWYQGVKEITLDKEVVWEYRTEKPNEIPNCQPLPNGGLMIGIVGECRLIELNAERQVTGSWSLSTSEKKPHAQFRFCRKTAEDTWLVPFTAEGAVREYSAEGALLRAFPKRPMPVGVLRLENGNTLISADHAVLEYARDDTVVWELSAKDLPGIDVGYFAGIHRLKNGHTLVCNWNSKNQAGRRAAHILEVDAQKRVIWMIGGEAIGQAAQCQVLKEDWTPVAEDAMEGQQ